MFINFTNHPSSLWDEEQTNAARQYGEIVDILFPAIDPKAPKKEISLLTDKYVEDIQKKASPKECVVHVQGEQTFCYSLIQKLQSLGYRCLASCTERIVHINEAGEKVSSFRFAGFREYNSDMIKKEIHKVKHPYQHSCSNPLQRMLKSKDTYSKVVFVLLVAFEISTMFWIQKGQWLCLATLFAAVFLIAIIMMEWIGRANNFRFGLQTRIVSKLLASAIAPRYLGTIYLIAFVVHLGWLDGAVLSLFLEDAVWPVIWAIIVCAIGILSLIVFFPDTKKEKGTKAEKLFVSGISNIRVPQNGAYDDINLLPLVLILKLVEQDDKFRILILLSDTITPDDSSHLQQVMHLVKKFKEGEMTQMVDCLEQIRNLIREVARREFPDKPWLPERLNETTIEFTEPCNYSVLDDAYRILEKKVTEYDKQGMSIYFNATPGTSIIGTLMTLLAIDGDRHLYYYSQEKMQNADNATEEAKIKFRRSLLLPVDKTKIPLKNLLSQALDSYQ